MKHAKKNVQIISDGDIHKLYIKKNGCRVVLHV